MKWRNIKRNYRGMIFDSGRELDRYLELVQRQKDGEIRDLKRQVSFEVIPKCGPNRAAHYIADFTYHITRNNEYVVEDAKGCATDVYKLKKKLMLFVHGIEVKEV